MRTGTLALALASFVAILSLVVLSSARDKALAAAPPYNPVAGFCIEQFESQPECDGDTSPGGSPDLRTKFCLGWGPDQSGNICSIPPNNAAYLESNSGGLVGFIPANFELVPGAPIGSIGGVLTTTAQLGLLNGPCDKKIGVNFTLLNGSVNPNDVIEPKTVGESNVIEPLAQDNNGNTIPDGVDKYPIFLRNQFDPDWDEGPDGRPNYGEPSDDVLGSQAPVAPIARLGGFTKIEGSWVSLQFLMFKPGDLLPFAGDDVTFRHDLGFPLVTVLLDPTVPPSPGAISDFCAPLRVENVDFGLTRDNPCTGIDTAGTRGNCPDEFNTALGNLGYPLSPCDPVGNIDDDQDGVVNDGCPQVNAIAETGDQCLNDTSDDGEDSTVNDGCPQVGNVSEGAYIGGTCSGNNEGGCPRFKLPAQAGDVFISLVTASQRDADGDGHENTIDTCSLKANPSWSPRVNDFANDGDADGLPNICDPNPSSPSPQSPLTSGNPNRSCFDTGIVGGDEDQDCYSNRQDNCPLHDQQDLGLSASSAFDNTPLQTDSDGDGIGDACDVTDCSAPPPSAYKGDPAQYVTFCQLFGTGTGGAAIPDGDRAIVCLMGTLAIGSPPSLSLAFPNIDPSCYLSVATPTPPPVTPAPSPPPIPPGFHDARAARLQVPNSVDLSKSGTGRVKFTVVNDGNHFESIGVYLDVIPPTDGNCFPAGRIVQTVLHLNPKDRVTLTVDGYPGDPTPGDGKVTFACSQPVLAQGQNYAFILAVDAHGDDLPFCPPNALLSPSCRTHLNDDDAVATHNIRIRTGPTVVIR
jgi:hypothetical protein